MREDGDQTEPWRSPKGILLNLIRESEIEERHQKVVGGRPQCRDRWLL